MLTIILTLSRQHPLNFAPWMQSLKGVLNCRPLSVKDWAYSLLVNDQSSDCYCWFNSLSGLGLFVIFGWFLLLILWISNANITRHIYFHHTGEMDKYALLFINFMYQRDLLWIITINLEGVLLFFIVILFVYAPFTRFFFNLKKTVIFFIIIY